MEIMFKSGKGLTLQADPGQEASTDESEKLKTDFLSYLTTGTPLGGKYKLKHGRNEKEVILRFDEVVFVA